MHLLLRADEEALKAAAARIARERGIFTFAGSAPGQGARTRVVEFTVGDATLKFKPEEVADLISEIL